MNENNKVENNQNNELVQSSETNLQNNIEPKEKATLQEGEVAFSETIENNNTENTEPNWSTIKIDESNIDYTYINNSYIDNKAIDPSENILIEKKKNIFSNLLKNKWFYIVCVLIISLICLLSVLFSIASESKKKEQSNNTNNNPSSEINNPINKEDKLIRRKTDGVLVLKEEANKWPFAVTIENSIDARPLSGVNDANIVYEALVEGSITRFLCIYSGTENIGKIGPVRSARPYFTDIADEYNSLFIHFGGSPEALDRLKKGYYNVTDMDGIIYDGKYFWRDNSRSAPHNAYISSDLINKFKSDKGIDKTNGNFSEWLYSEKNIKDSISANYLKSSENIEIQYSDQTTAYNVAWKYESSSGSYVRYYENEKKDKDSLNQDIKTKNVIIQFAGTSLVPNDDKLRKEINLTEGGKAIMIRDGYSIEGYWKKNSFTNRTKFYTIINGKEQEFEFNPGKTWVNIVPKDYKIKIY